MKRGAASLALALSLLPAACGGAPPTGLAPTATSSPVATLAPTATTAAPSVSSTPRPSPMVSAKGAIAVTSPLRGDQITSPLTIAGEASVFEATVSWRVVTGGGQVLARGNVLATAGAPLRGTFTTSVTFTLPYSGEAGFVEVYEVSPKDGSISDIVRVPVGIAGVY